MLQPVPTTLYLPQRDARIDDQGPQLQRGFTIQYFPASATTLTNSITSDEQCPPYLPHNIPSAYTNSRIAHPAQPVPMETTMHAHVQYPTMAYLTPVAPHRPFFDQHHLSPSTFPLKHIARAHAPNNISPVPFEFQANRNAMTTGVLIASPLNSQLGLPVPSTTLSRAPSISTSFGRMAISPPSTPVAANLGRLPQQTKPVCKATKKDGFPCGAPARANSDYCVRHKKFDDAARSDGVTVNATSTRQLNDTSLSAGQDYGLEDPMPHPRCQETSQSGSLFTQSNTGVRSTLKPIHLPSAQNPRSETSSKEGLPPLVIALDIDFLGPEYLATHSRGNNASAPEPLVLSNIVRVSAMTRLPPSGPQGGGKKPSTSVEVSPTRAPSSSSVRPSVTANVNGGEPQDDEWDDEPVDEDFLHSLIFDAESLAVLREDNDGLVAWRMAKLNIIQSFAPPLRGKKRARGYDEVDCDRLGGKAQKKQKRDVVMMDMD